MAIYYKPQSPIQSGEDFIYPITTADQVILSDGSRLEKVGKINADKLDGRTLAEIMLALYPVGAVYISANSTSPASLFGGTWESIGGRFLLGADSTYTAGSTGGEATHTLTENEMPTHKHRGITIAGNKLTCWSNSGSGGVFDMSSLFNGSGNTTNDFIAEPVGGGAAHNNMPPYLAVYMWKRVR